MDDEDGAGRELDMLPEDEAWELVGRRELGRLVVCIAGVPEVFPVNYRLDTDGAVVVRTAPGLKLAGAVLGGEVAFEVDEIDEAARTGWSVVIHGPATEVVGTEARLRADDLGVDPWIASPRHRYLRVAPGRITGRRVG